jgi:hypothetical protein
MRWTVSLWISMAILKLFADSRNLMRVESSISWGGLAVKCSILAMRAAISSGCDILEVGVFRAGLLNWRKEDRRS